MSSTAGTQSSIIRARLFFVAPLCLQLLTSDAPINDGARRGVQQRSDTIVKVVGAPRHPGTATLVSEVKIGGAAATADEYIFSEVSEVVPLRDGSIIVADRGSGASVFVRQYDAQGKYVRTLGRFGQGPGEYRNPSGIAQLADGRIIIRDGVGSRINVYPPSGPGQGELLAAATFSGTSTGTDYMLVGPDGAIYQRVPSRMAFAGRAAVRGGYARLRVDGSVIDTLFAPELPDVGPPPLVVTSGGGYGTSGVPFAPSSISAFSPLGYFVTARTDRYALNLLIPPARGATGSGPRVPWAAGDPVTSIRHRFAPVPANDAERAERRKSIEERMRATDPAWQWTGADIPRVKPAFKLIKVGSDGRLWVQLSTLSERFDPAAEPSAGGGGGGGGGGITGVGTGGAGAPPPLPPRSPITWREPVRYDVFDPDGTYQGSVSVPYNTSISAMRGDNVWGIVRDADGTQSVHRFRISW